MKAFDSFVTPTKDRLPVRSSLHNCKSGPFPYADFIRNGQHGAKRKKKKVRHSNFTGRRVQKICTIKQSRLLIGSLYAWDQARAAHMDIALDIKSTACRFLL